MRCAFRLMREKHLVALTRRRCRKTTDSKHTFPIAPNLLQRNFTAQGPDESWVTDITFLWTRQGWLYLAVILATLKREIEDIDSLESLAGATPVFCENWKVYDCVGTASPEPLH